MAGSYFEAVVVSCLSVKLKILLTAQEPEEAAESPLRIATQMSSKHTAVDEGRPESDITPLAKRGAAALADTMGGGVSDGQREIEGKIVAKIASIVQPDRHGAAFAKSMQTKVSPTQMEEPRVRFSRVQEL